MSKKDPKTDNAPRVLTGVLSQFSYQVEVLRGITEQLNDLLCELSVHPDQQVDTVGLASIVNQLVFLSDQGRNTLRARNVQPYLLPHMKPGDFLPHPGSDDLPVIDALEIKTAKMKLLSEEGAFGTVFVGKCRGQKVAIKVLQLNLRSAEDKEMFVWEVDAMRRLRHPNIVVIMGLSYLPSSCIAPHILSRMFEESRQGSAAFEPPMAVPAIVTELLDGSVNKLIRERTSLSILARFYIILDCAKGIAWMHRMNPPMIHCDIKPNNFLYRDAGMRSGTPRFEIKVSDFGLSIIRSGCEIDYSARGSPLYLAPETMDNTSNTVMSDSWAFGITAWEIFTGLDPYEEDLKEWSIAAIAKYVRGGGRCRITKEISDNMRFQLLLERCWHRDPNLRPNMTEAVRDMAGLIMDVAIKCPYGISFWRDNFGDKEEVEWNTFVHKLTTVCVNSEEMGNVKPRSPAQAALAAIGGVLVLPVPSSDNVKEFSAKVKREKNAYTLCLRYLRAIATEAGCSATEAFDFASATRMSDYNRVTMESFGRALRAFGCLQPMPMQPPFGSKGHTEGIWVPFLMHVVEVLDSGYFFGHMTAERAIAKLSSMPNKTGRHKYLLRFSSDPDSVTLSSTHPEWNHTRIQRDVDGMYTCSLVSDKCGTIPEMVAVMCKKYKLKEFPRDSPYAGLKMPESSKTDGTLYAI